MPHLGHQSSVSSCLLTTSTQVPTPGEAGIQASTEHDSEVQGGRTGWGLCKPAAPYLAQRGQQWEIDGLTVPQDAYNAIQVHLVLAEAACENEDQSLPQSHSSFCTSLGLPLTPLPPPGWEVSICPRLARTQYSQRTASSFTYCARSWKSWRKDMCAAW